jgi:hypothetical protein
LRLSWLPPERRRRKAIQKFRTSLSTMKQESGDD